MQMGLLSDFGRAGIDTASLIAGCTVGGAVTVKGLSVPGGCETGHGGCSFFVGMRQGPL